MKSSHHRHRLGTQFLNLARKLGTSGFALHKAGVPFGASERLARDLLAIDEQKKNGPEPECAECDHPQSEHPDDGPCTHDACDCKSFEPPEVSAVPSKKPDAPSSKSAVTARAERARELGIDPEKYEATHQALFGDRRSDAPKGDAVAARAERAREQGLDPAKLEATHQALFGGRR